MENAIFNWDTWEDIDQLEVEYTGVTLLIPVGSFPKGTKFPRARLDAERLLMTLDQREDTKEDDPDKVHIFKLILTVGEQMPTPRRRKRS